MLHYCCKVQESSGKQWKMISLQAVKNVRSLMVSEASAENNYAVNRLLRARDLAALLKGRLWDPSKGSSEPSHGTFWEKADDDKTPYSQTGCLHWGEWSCAFQDCLQPGKYRIKYDPTDNWVGTSNKLSCDLHSTGSQPLDNKTNRKWVWGLRQEENLAWKFSWNTHLALCLWALPVLSRALCSHRIQPTLAQAVPPACAHHGKGQPRTLPWLLCLELGPSCPPGAASSVWLQNQDEEREFFCSLVAFISVLCGGDVMRMMTRTKDDQYDEVKAILKQFVLNG